MKKVILEQRFNYADILPYKNFSTLNEKKFNGGNTFDTESTYEEYDDDAIFGNLKIKEIKISKPKSHASFSLYSKDDYPKKNTKFFYSGENGVGVRIPLKLYFPKFRSFLTTKDRHIKNHYNRPFSAISTHTYIRKIEISEDKLSVRLYHGYKNRGLNSIFFKKNWSSEGFSINLKNGDFYTFTVNKKNKRIRKNSFKELKDFFTAHALYNFEPRINNLTEQSEYGSDKKFYSPIKKEFLENFSDLEFLSNLYHVFKNDLKVEVKDVQNSEWLYLSIISFFVNKKGIKVPNDYHYLLTQWYPTVKYLKKNDNKLIASILDRIGIKSKHTIKILHEVPNIDITRFNVLKRYFGIEDFHKYIGNLNPQVFRGTIKSEKYTSSYNYFEDEVNVINLSDKERYCILKLLNQFAEVRADYETKTYSDDLYSKFRQIDDHLNLIRKIKPTFPDTEFTATDWDKFHEEHLQFSRLQHLISRGYTIEFLFDDKLIETLEKPIESSGVTYYPVILKKDIEYTEEGQHMHHCVGSYSERESSLIISLREGSKNANKRVTCEYNTSNKMVVQERHFCNGAPPIEFIPVLQILRERVGGYDGSIKSKEKIKTPFSKDKILTMANVQPIGDPFQFL